MHQNQTDLLTDSLQEINSSKRRCQLLPWWIKAFMWLFLILGAFVPIIIVLGIMNYEVQLALYGLETNHPFSIIGLSLIVLFFIKAMTAFGLLKEKDWATKLAIGDSIIGIVLCGFLMMYSLISESRFTFRIELFLLIPYLLKMLKIKPEWERGNTYF